MYRLRIHARGGQGAKTAGRVLGSALFAEGFEVQDAPQYGAERRGAPVLAMVRAAREPILERGAIEHPQLLVVADATLLPVATAGVLAGVTEETVTLIHGEESAATWRERLGLLGPVLRLEPRIGEARDLRFVGLRCAGAAARLLGVVSRASLVTAIRSELEELGAAVVAENLEIAIDAYEAFAEREGCVREAPAPAAAAPATGHWIELPLEEASAAAPDIHGSLTSLRVRTGLWRSLRPVVDLEHCRRCHWLCSTLCPDGAIRVLDDGAPEIDYEHCKGCMICVAVCPTHAIRSVPEARAREEEARP